jgi:hypothetical protein
MQELQPLWWLTVGVNRPAKDFPPGYRNGDKVVRGAGLAWVGLHFVKQSIELIPEPVNQSGLPRLRNPPAAEPAPGQSPLTILLLHH